MTNDEAKQAALQYLMSAGVSEQIAFYDDLCQQKPYGWVLFYNTKRFVETGDILYAFGGNGPLVVMAETGEVIPSSSANEPEDGIREIERARGLVD